MKKIIAFCGLFLGLSAITYADDVSINRAGNLGFGIGLGQPMGATGKFWMSPNAAVDAFLGYHFNHNFDMHTDALYHFYPFATESTGQIPLYVGAGARILAGDDTQFGLRFPLGIAYQIPRSKAEFFAEAGPVVVLNGIRADADGMVGIRMYTY